jgi:hypothetical protein
VEKIIEKLTIVQDIPDRAQVSIIPAEIEESVVLFSNLADSFAWRRSADSGQIIMLNEYWLSKGLITQGLTAKVCALYRFAT